MQQLLAILSVALLAISSFAQDGGFRTGNVSPAPQGQPAATGANTGAPQGAVSGPAGAPASGTGQVNQPTPGQNTGVEQADSANDFNTSGVVNTQNGFVTGVAAPNVVSTPIINLNTVGTSPVGASSATPGLQAGASSSTLGTAPATPNAITTQVQGSNWGGGGAVNPGMTDAGFSGAGPDIADLSGFTYEGSAYASGTKSDDRSLAEIAASFRKPAGTQHARVYTNADLQRLNDADQSANPRSMDEIENAQSNEADAAQQELPASDDIEVPQQSPEQPR